MAEILDRALALGYKTLSTFHPTNFLRPIAISTATTTAQKIIKSTATNIVTRTIPTVIKNSPTNTILSNVTDHINHVTTNLPITGITTVLPNDIGSIGSIGSIGIENNENFTYIFSFETFSSVEFWFKFFHEFTSSPLQTINRYFQLPSNIIESIIILTISSFIISALIYSLYSFIYRAIYGQTTNIPIQVLDVAVFDGFKPEWRIQNSTWLSCAQARFNLHGEEIKFMKMITDRSGIGHATHYAPGIVQWPADLGFAASRLEAEIVMYHCIDKLMMNNNIRAEDIDIVVTNCSLFNPTPSMASMIVNHYKLRSDVQSFHLGGMGCGISPLSVNVASSCLRLHPKKHPIAIVVSMEVITPNIYNGRERAFMLQNALFRIGGAAVLLTRDSEAVLGRPQPKWTIEHSTHIHTAANTDAYTCVFQDIDCEERQGVRLDKALMSVAAGAITRNLTLVGPKILPLYAKIDYVVRLTSQIIRKKLNTIFGKNDPNVKEKLVVPNFRLAVQHFCVHAGGRAVLTAIQDSLSLTDADMKPSRDTLYTYGNTSSSSIWYEYNQVENTREPKKGDVMLLIAVGSGFKANLLCLKALKNIKATKRTNEEDGW